MTSPQTILVAYASVGSGHRLAAEAIAAEIESREGSHFHAELVDVLARTRRVSGDRLSSTFVGPTSGVYDALWRSPLAGSVGRALGGPLLRAILGEFSQRVDEPDVAAIVSTHAMPAVIAAHRSGKAGRAPKVIDVATDFGAHTFWPLRGVDRFCVADDSTRESLLSRGFSAQQVVVTGIPTRRQFTREYDREAALAHFGLTPEKRIILALAGSMMAGPYERLKGALAVSLPALASLPNTDVVVVCGHDDRFAEDLKTRAAGFGTPNVQVLGFVHHMAPLMSCADLVIAKPGGVVCAEALAVGVPLVLVGPAAGQEKANAHALAQCGTATFSADPRLLAEHVRKVASKPARLKKMRTAALAAGRPFAASDVVEQVLGLLPI
jgi:processive 1,2-diacylglycerol beta-glucosyltransferase